MLHPKLYFIRHGETDWNAERRLQGQHDIPLNARGFAQASHSGDVLRDLLGRSGRAAEEFAFIASPLSRARQTMELVRGRLGLDPRRYCVDARLAELSFGRWEGLTFAEIDQCDAALVTAREHDKWNFVPPGGESYAQLLARVREWQAGLGGDTIAVAHGGVARTLFVHYGIMPPAQAPLGDIAQGIVYEFAPGELTRHE